MAAVTARLTIAYDSSPAAATAVGAAAALFPGARASVVTVSAPPPTSAAMLQQVAPTLSPGSVQSTIDELWAEATEGARAMAEEGVARAAAHGLQAEVATVPPHASTWEALLAAAHDEGADVLVCGARGRSGFSRALLGSTSTSLLHHADLPLLVVPDGSGTLDGPVLIAYDGSDAAKQAIDVAGRLLSGRPALVVHVWESQFRRGLTMRVLAQGAMAGIVEQLDGALAEAAAATTDEGVALARAAGLEASGETLEASAGIWRVVASAARTHDAAVVVTGARGIGGARSALLGSVSSGLIHNAELPILVVHAPLRSSSAGHGDHRAMGVAQDSSADAVGEQGVQRVVAARAQEQEVQTLAAPRELVGGAPVEDRAFREHVGG